MWTCVGMHGYAAAHVERALEGLAKLEQPLPVTWAVRLPIIRQTSAELVRRLTEDGRTLTCWGEMGSREELWLSQHHIRPLAFVDSIPPAFFLQTTSWTQRVATLVLFGATLAALLRSRRGASFWSAVIPGKPKDLSV